MNVKKHFDSSDSKYDINPSNNNPRPNNENPARYFLHICILPIM